MKNMKNSISVMMSAVILGGCNMSEPKVESNWETLDYKFKPQLEACSDIDKKFLKSYSFMQILSELGEKENIQFTFTPSSVDVYIENLSFQSWSDALFWLDHRSEYSVKIYGYAEKKAVKTIEIRKNVPSFFNLHTESKILLSKDGVETRIGKFKVDDKSTSGVMSDFIKTVDFQNKYLTTERFLNDFYYYHKEMEDSPVYFSYEYKPNAIHVGKEPEMLLMTPYKLRIFKNYLDANKITYKESNDNKLLYIEDNFLLWKKAMNYLKVINKYDNHIYGVKTDDGYYEIADGKYPALPIAIELITWTPSGEREFNIYYNNMSRKVITKERNFVFFTPDTQKKFIIRTY